MWGCSGNDKVDIHWGGCLRAERTPLGAQGAVRYLRTMRFYCENSLILLLSHTFVYSVYWSYLWGRRVNIWKATLSVWNEINIHLSCWVKSAFMIITVKWREVWGLQGMSEFPSPHPTTAASPWGSPGRDGGRGESERWGEWRVAEKLLCARSVC